MADLFLKKTLNARLRCNFVKHELWFLCQSAFVNRIAIFDYDFNLFMVLVIPITMCHLVM